MSVCEVCEDKKTCWLLRVGSCLKVAGIEITKAHCPKYEWEFDRPLELLK